MADKLIAIFDIRPFEFLETAPDTGDGPRAQGLFGVPVQSASDREFVRSEARAFFDKMLDLWLGPRKS